VNELFSIIWRLKDGKSSYLYEPKILYLFGRTKKKDVIITCALEQCSVFNLFSK
jgi:hypothetical protein